jgi:hypothetical protein
MPKTVQIRDIDDDTYAALQRQAGAAGISVPEYLRREIRRLAALPSMQEWLQEVSSRPRSNMTTQEILDALDEIRGPWPEGFDAGR